MVISESESYTSLIQTMLDAAIHGIVLLEPVYDSLNNIRDFTIKAANASIENHVGFSIDSNTRPRMRSVFPAYEKHGFYQLFVKAFLGRAVQREELFYKDYRIEGWFDVGAAASDHLLVVTFSNITENKQQQQTIEHWSDKLQKIINTAQSGIFLTSPVRDKDGTIIDFVFNTANPFLAAMAQVKPEELIGQRGSVRFPAYKTNGLFELYIETFETGKTNRLDFHYAADDLDVFMDFMITKINDNELLITFTDYTPLKHLQIQLEQSINDLKQSNANLEEFAYAASHDLQEPLRKIDYLTAQLLKDYQHVLNEDGVSLVTRFEKLTGRMRTLINDLLSYSHVGSTPKATEHVDLNQVLLEVQEWLEVTIHQKYAMISTDKLPVIKGDKLQLHQLFQNLLSNSLKYSKVEEPPVITITYDRIMGKDAQGVDVPAPDCNKGFHRITIKDNGIGFNQEYASTIFRIFQRLHTAEYSGTGIGLAIVQKVIQNHQGYISAHGTPGEGASFTILLPK